MAYRVGTIVTPYKKDDGIAFNGHRTCSAYQFDPEYYDELDVCIGIVTSCVESDVTAQWIAVCTIHHEQKIRPYRATYYHPDELWEIEQIH